MSVLRPACTFNTVLSIMNRLLLALALAGASSPVWAQNQPAANPKPASPPAKPATPAVPAPAPAGGVAADVNGDKISMGDLNRMVDAVKASDPGLRTGSPTALKALSDIRDQMLDRLISRQLWLQEARRQKITPAPKAIDDAAAPVRANFKSDADFQKWLQADGKSVADFRRKITEELMISEVQTRLTADTTVSADDIGAYYRAHLDAFTVPETVSARHIMLALNPNASQADKDAVNKRAQNLLAQARKKGADFSALAKTNSDDVTSKDSGGDMGTFARGEMIEPIEKACFDAKAGDVVGPITTEFGLHIIRIDAKTPSSVIPLTQVQDNPDLKALLSDQKSQARLSERLAKLRADAKIQKYI